MKGDQLALAVQLNPVPSFQNFFAGPNRLALETVQQVVRAGGPAALYLYGAAASGKSHLLKAAAGDDPVLLSLNDSGQCARLHDPALDAAPLLALDDIEPALADPDAALRLLRLLDRRRQQGRALLVAARSAPARLPVALPDLRTRLESMVLLGLKPLGEEHRRELLRLQAQARGLELAADAVSWLLNRLPRDAGSLIAALERVDRASLSAQRRPTVPFLQQVLTPVSPPPPGHESARTSSG
ncbi:HdaA/DnaA family protein [Panacagrimonas sp.]|uniref:HdaA/DnaA family protein n=1 Tax=Panacagrimonas sp. TaxID=2480088 RepID=UPI003B51D531